MTKKSETIMKMGKEGAVDIVYMELLMLCANDFFYVYSFVTVYFSLPGRKSVSESVSIKQQ